MKANIDGIYKKRLRAQMRHYALGLREKTHPDYCPYNFSTRMNHAAADLVNAIAYRDMSHGKVAA